MWVNHSVVCSRLLLILAAATIDVATPPGNVVMLGLFLNSAPTTPSASCRVTALSFGNFAAAFCHSEPMSISVYWLFWLLVLNGSSQNVALMSILMMQSCDVYYYDYVMECMTYHGASTISLGFRLNYFY